MPDVKVAVLKARVAWNSFRELFNPASEEVLQHPELKPVLEVMQRLADFATAGAPVVRQAIADAGLDSLAPLTAGEQAAADRAMSVVTTALSEFEIATGLQITALLIDHVDPASPKVSDVVYIR